MLRYRFVFECTYCCVDLLYVVLYVLSFILSVSVLCLHRSPLFPVTWLVWLVISVVLIIGSSLCIVVLAGSDWSCSSSFFDVIVSV